MTIQRVLTIMVAIIFILLIILNMLMLKGSRYMTVAIMGATIATLSVIAGLIYWFIHQPKRD